MTEQLGLDVVPDPVYGCCGAPRPRGTSALDYPHAEDCPNPNLGVWFDRWGRTIRSLCCTRERPCPPGRAVAGSTRPVWADTAARQNVAEFITALRDLGEAEGPWAFANWLDAPEATEPRVIAYLLVWRDGPNWSVWAALNRLDAVDLAIDALTEGFDAFLAVYPTQ